MTDVRGTCPLWAVATPGQVGLDCIGKQAEDTKKQCSSMVCASVSASLPSGKDYKLQNEINSLLSVVV